MTADPEPDPLADQGSGGATEMRRRNVEVDGRCITAVIAGRGVPTVVFESAMGTSSHEWWLVVPAIARRTSVVTYDRAGLGQSQPDREPRTLEHLTADLTRALEGLEARPPFILVGHSWGGAIVRLFAAQHRELVAGMVLVDASHEATLGSSFISPAGRVLFWLMGRGTFLCLKMLALAGLGKLLARRSLGSRIFSKMTSEDRAQALWELSAASTYRTGRREVAHEHAGLQALARLPLPSVPVVAITGSKAPCFARKQRRFINDIYEKWTEALPNGEHVIAYRSGHLVPQSEPELVGRAIDSLIDRSTQ